MIFFGYISILSVVIILIVLAEIVLNKIIDKEYCRKILHIGTFFVFPLGNLFLGQGSIHFIIICAIFSIATLILYFLKVFKTVDGRTKNYPGIFYYALSLLILSIICYFNNELNVYFGVAFIGLAIGDGFATLIGYMFNGKKIYKDKTYIGFISCLLATAVALLIYSSLNNYFINIYQIILISILISIIELIDYGLDNFAIPILSFFFTIFILNSQTALIALVIFELVFLIVFLLKIIDYYGALVSSLIGFLYYYFGGLYAILFVVGCYLIMLAVSLIGKVLKNDVSNVVKKTGCKDFIEIFVNGIWSIISILLYALTKNDIFFVISLITMSEGFVDSLASDIGTLSKKEPYDIIKKEYVKKGVSGGVTLLGSIASLSGALIFAILIKIICDLPSYLIIILTIIIYLGSIMDSVFGSTIQVKFKCQICGIITEKENHCDNQTEVVSGLKWINNDVVNCLSGLFVFVLSMLLFVIL